MNRTVLTLALIALFVFAINGCSKQPVQDSTPEPAPVVINCNDASIKNGLVKALSDRLKQKITEAVADYLDSELEILAWQRLDDIAIDLQNAHNQDDICQADAIVILPMSDIQNANQYYGKTASPSVAERAISQDIALGADTRFVAPVRYQVVDGTVVLQDGSALPTLIADTLSASAYTMSNTKSKVKARKPVVAVPTTKQLPDIGNGTAPQTPVALDTAQLLDTPIDEHLPVQGDETLVIIELDETY